MSILHSLFSTIIIATIFIATTAAAANTGSDSDTKKVPNTNKKRNTSTIRNAKKSTSSTHPFHQKPSTRIVGGTYVQKPGTYPWFTQLLYYSYIYDEYKEVSCSGMLITPQFVLTAAHCITDTLKQEKINEGHNITNAAVRIGAFQSPYQQGDNGGQDVEFRTVKNIYVHPDYEYHTVDNDFALLHLSEASTIPVVQIDTEGLSDSFVTGRDTLWAVGFGKTHAHFGITPTELKHVEVPYISNHDCTESNNYNSYEITDNMLCAGKLDFDACQGDSGGPLYDSRNNVLIGIVSWGIGCAWEGYPGVYARISSQHEWIEGVIAAAPPLQNVGNSTLCTDSPSRFRFAHHGKRYTRSCAWVGRESKNRCNNERYSGLSLMCPSACGTCSECVDSPLRFRVTKDDGNTIVRNCGWVANAKNKRCEYDGVSDTCRRTCGSCQLH